MGVERLSCKGEGQELVQPLPAQSECFEVGDWCGVLDVTGCQAGEMAGDICTQAHIANCALQFLIEVVA